MDFTVCHNDSDLIGNEFNYYSTLVYIVSETGKQIYCYTKQEIIKLTRDLTVSEWDTSELDQSKKKPVTNFINGLWIDHVSIDLLKYFSSFIMKEIRNQEIGSHIGVSRIHGSDYPLYRLIPVKRKLIYKANKEIKNNIEDGKNLKKLLNQKNEGEIIACIEYINIPSVKKYSNGIAVGDIIEKDDELHIKGKFTSDQGKTTSIKGKLSELFDSEGNIHENNEEDEDDMILEEILPNVHDGEDEYGDEFNVNDNVYGNMNRDLSEINNNSSDDTSIDSSNEDNIYSEENSDDELTSIPAVRGKILLISEDGDEIDFNSISSELKNKVYNIFKNHTEYVGNEIEKDIKLYFFDDYVFFVYQYLNPVTMDVLMDIPDKIKIDRISYNIKMKDYDNEYYLPEDTPSYQYDYTYIG